MAVSPEFADRRADSPFTTEFYNDPTPPTREEPAGGRKPVWEVAPESLIVAPAADASIADEVVEIWGRHVCGIALRSLRSKGRRFAISGCLGTSTG